MGKTSKMDKYTFVSPCGVKDTHTDEIEYFETSVIAKEEMAKKEAAFWDSPAGNAYLQKENFNATQDNFFDDMEDRYFSDVGHYLAEQEGHERVLNTIPLNVPGIDENGYDCNGVHVSSILFATSPEAAQFAKQGKSLSDLLRDRDAIEMK